MIVVAAGQAHDLRFVVASSYRQCYTSGVPKLSTTHF
jgi:hypothetical protein